MTAATRQQRKRDRIKAGLVRIEVWVPSDKADDVQNAIEEMITPTIVSNETLRAIRTNAGKADTKALERILK